MGPEIARQVLIDLDPLLSRVGSEEELVLEADVTDPILGPDSGTIIQSDSGQKSLIKDLLSYQDEPINDAEEALLSKESFE